MAYQKKTWKDRQTEHPARRKLTKTTTTDVYDVTRDEGLIIDEGDPINAVNLNGLEGRIETAFADTATQMGNMATVATHAKMGTVHSLALDKAATAGIQMVQFAATADYTEGDTWTVDGVAFAAKLQGEDGTLTDKYFVAGDMVNVMLDPAGKKLGFKSGGKPPVPSIFGDGSDGDLYIAAGETVVLPVTVPHQSVVEKQYKSIIIEAGGALKCSDPNAGLVLRCKGDCTIHGTIDQSLMAPKTNPNNNYRYPAELMCGDGGNGGDGGALTQSATTPAIGGTAMRARVYGGGYSGPGASGNGMGKIGAAGSDSNLITVSIPDSLMFKGGTEILQQGINGGGSSGSGNTNFSPAQGGTGPGGNGAIPTSVNDGLSGGGGAANFGGGVVVLYICENFIIDGQILCNGGKGGDGGRGNYSAGGGGAAGGAGGGAIYICYNAISTISGNLNVAGGVGGIGGQSNGGIGKSGQNGLDGIIGTVTIKKYIKHDGPEDMFYFNSMPSKDYIRLAWILPNEAQGVVIRRKTTPWAEGDNESSGGFVVHSTTNMSGPNKWHEDTRASVAGQQYYYKAFPYVGTAYNCNAGVNETTCKAGGLWAEWTFDDITGTTIQDTSGNGRNTTFPAGAAAQIPCAVGLGAIGVGTGAAAALPILPDVRTLSCMVKNPPQYIAESDAIYYRTDGLTNLLFRSSKMSVAFVDNVDAYAENNFVVNQQNFWTISQNGKAGVKVITKNIEKVFENVVNNASSQTYRYFLGGPTVRTTSTLDQFRVFSRVLEDYEIANLYNNGKGC